MRTSAVEIHAQADGVEFSDSELVVSLVDGRKITVPLIWFPLLYAATKTQLENYELLGGGEGIHWPEIDEDLSVAGLLLGNH